MDQPAGSLLYNKEEAIYALHLRESLRSHKIPIKEISDFLKSVNNDERTYFSWFSIEAKQKWFIFSLEYFKSEWIKQKSYIPLKSKTCAETLLQIGITPLLKQAVTYYKKGSINTFISYFDYVEGMMEVTNAIFEAVSELEGKTEKIDDEATFEWLKHRKSLPTDTTDITTAIRKKETENSAELFLKDPSGFQLISQVVKEIEEEAEDFNSPDHLCRRILPHQYSQLFVTGAHFANKLYSALYDLWKPLEGNKLNNPFMKGAYS